MTLKNVLEKHPLTVVVVIVITTITLTTGVLTFLYENFRIPALLAKSDNPELKFLRQEVESLKTNSQRKNMVSYNIQPVKYDEKAEVLAEIERLKLEYVDRGYSKYENDPPDPDALAMYRTVDEPTPEEKRKAEEDAANKKAAKVFVKTILDKAEGVKSEAGIKWCKERLERLAN